MITSSETYVDVGSEEVSILSGVGQVQAYIWYSVKVLCLLLIGPFLPGCCIHHLAQPQIAVKHALISLSTLHQLNTSSCTGQL